VEIGLSVRTIWKVPTEDKERARKLLEGQPPDIILGYILEARKGHKNLSAPTIEAEELED